MDTYPCHLHGTGIKTLIPSLTLAHAWHGRAVW